MRFGFGDEAKWCDRVDLEQFPPHRRCGALKIGVRDHCADSSVVDQYVKTPGEANGIGDEPMSVRIVCEVRLDVVGVAEFGSQRFSGLGRRT